MWRRLNGSMEEADGRGAARDGAGVRRLRGEEGGGAAGGRGRPRQVGPTCRRLCEREGGKRPREAELGRVGRKRTGPRL
jgi:hypothetical protein